MRIKSTVIYYFFMYNYHLFPLHHTQPSSPLRRLALPAVHPIIRPCIAVKPYIDALRRPVVCPPPPISQ